MTDLFASGRIIDVVLGLVALEAVVLLLWCRRKGPAPFPLLCNLASGASLMLGVRMALTDAPWPFVAACLLGALLAHACELAVRLRQRQTVPMQPLGDEPGRTRGTDAETVAFAQRRRV
ncbi:hypothetical protein [Methylobacterium sp. Leaf466]|uniref:hypothetical protein n=1 Tax=Methylobacterium sp. Leaf466 TaxID=1736386 RepID=UPI00070102B1|nr:hypothetical protein [Methylobacterium sp. Leaf466]KQT88835.1 hypothetical protein ASG59_14700 [Methylobacterium sp. Leaf466]